jgi:hypothetical protein
VLSPKPASQSIPTRRRRISHQTQLCRTRRSSHSAYHHHAAENHH